MWAGIGIGIGIAVVIGCIVFAEEAKKFLQWFWNQF